MDGLRRGGRVVLVYLVAAGVGWVVASLLGDILPGWLVWPVTFVIVMGLALITLRRRGPSHTRSPSDPDLSASDEYSDLQLGRRPATPPPHETGATSQLGDPNPGDPLTLPPRDDRREP